MKKVITLAFAIAIIVSGCGTHAAQGALTGSQAGSVLGSAIGGLSDGWRGSNVGTIAGMVGGAVVGGAIGNAFDNADKKKRELRRSTYDDSYGGRSDLKSSPTRFSPLAELRNIMFYDDNNNGRLSREENGSIEFEILNTSGSSIYGIVPVVEEISGNKHVLISPSMQIESIGTDKSLRYTAYIKTDRKLKNGYVRFRISVYNSSKVLIAPRTEFDVETNR